MGRRDHARGDRDLAIFTHWSYRPLLEDAQDRALNLERQVADLVEEQGAVLGRDEQPCPLLQRAREGSLRVTEELGGDQVT